MKLEITRIVNWYGVKPARLWIWKSLHSFKDVDEVRYTIAILWWRFSVSKVGNGVLKNKPVDLDTFNK